MQTGLCGETLSLQAGQRAQAEGLTVRGSCSGTPVSSSRALGLEAGCRDNGEPKYELLKEFWEASESVALAAPGASRGALRLPVGEVQWEKYKDWTNAGSAVACSCL